MLHGELQVVEATALESLQEREFVSNIAERLWVVFKSLLIGDCDAGNARRSALQGCWNQFLQEIIRNQSDHYADRNRDESENDCEAPLKACLRWRSLRDGERLATDKNDQHLCATHCEVDADEKPILEQALKDVEAVVKATVTVFKSVLHAQGAFESSVYLLPLVENLHPHKCVENKSIPLLRLHWIIETKDGVCAIVEKKRDDQLVNGLSKNHLPHRDRNDA